MNSGRKYDGPVTDEQVYSADWLSKLVRPKGNIEAPVLAFLIVVACVPLVLALARIVAMPGIAPFTVFDFDFMRNLGGFLNQSLSLAWVPPADRSKILYLLLLPTGAVVITVARLTFGLRILGFRAILIAIGFQEVGVVPSLLLLGVVIGSIVSIRPSMRRIRLPLFARISIILCMTSIIMVAALLIAPIVRSEVLWGVAFFPVIILAMMAEGIAKTLARDNLVTAVWRASWTLIVAVIFALISTSTAVRDCAIHFPELMLTQLICIVLIAEYLDFRLLERWPARLSRLVEGEQGWRTEQPVVAVVRNRWNRGVIGRLGRPAAPKYRKRSVQALVDALRDEGFKVKTYEGDISLLKELHGLMPPDPLTGAPGGIVLNLATGVQGNGRFCQIPAMLELAGIAYSGPDPIAQANMLDRYILLSLLRDAGIDVPQFTLASCRPEEIDSLDFPISVRSRGEPDERSIKVKDHDALQAATETIMQSTGRPAMLEERIGGREIRVSLIGNIRLECLPLLERNSDKNAHKVCPAKLDDSTADLIRETAFNAYNAAGCRDYARIDMRLAEDGRPTVIAIHWDGVLARRGSFVRSAEAAGYSYAQLMHRVVNSAAARYGTVPTTATTTLYEPAEFSKWLPGKRVGAQ